VGAGRVLVSAREGFATFSVLEPLLLFLQLFPLGLQLGVRTGNLGGRKAPFPHSEENSGRGIRVVVDYCNVVLVFDPVAIGHRLAFDFLSLRVWFLLPVSSGGRWERAYFFSAW
jgi:hypothetical protein